jgi:outer membrane protein assembly factor BamD (BamD/ComL family)
MRVSRHLIILFFASIAAGIQPAIAQLGYQLDIPKPKPYEERELRAEKTGDKKLKAHKKFFQNLTTHYNYFFNASNKLNEVLDRAKQAHKDDYTKLLPFYNYTLDATAQDQQQLDSVIYKAQTGIVMHDLRNDWIDDLYLLWGASFYFQKKFDSAYQMFQFINWAFAEKEKDGYYRYIGSRMDGNNALSIATAENSSLLKKIVSDPPSRNNALVWLARVFMESGDMSGSGSLIATLRNDPLFPERLHSTLDEVQAYWYYRQGMWDSSATYLVRALDRAENKQERARWEYLAAQMFEKNGQTAEAEKLYNKAIAHTIDPVMDIYARLNLVRINKEGGENYIDQNIADLMKMARRDKYYDYRDVVYYMAAQMEIERNNPAAAQDYLLKAAKYNNGNLSSRSTAFLQIADLAYTQKKYMQAASFYDSVQVTDLSKDQLAVVEERKAMLSKLVPHLAAIARQDSLQRIAALPEAERDELVRKMARQLRRSQGLDDEDGATTTLPGSNNNTAPPTLFNNTNNARGEWYFYNENLKTQGLAQFRQVWGNRPNVDNWRRASNAMSALRNNDPMNTRGNPGTAIPDASPSYASLLARLPLTPAQMKASNDSIRNSLYASGIVYLNDMEDYPSAIAAFEDIRNRFPDFERMPEVLFNLHYAYRKSGDAAKAAQIKRLLEEKYPSSRQASILNTGKDPAAANSGSEATKAYEAVYDLFLEGRFTEAKEAKRRADSMYRTSTWQPQLLYIEAVYHIKEREDSVAKSILQKLIAQNPSEPLARKAQNMIQVLNRRREIEEELTNLQIERPVDTVTSTRTSNPVVQNPAPVRRDTIAANQPQNIPPVKPNPQPKKDTVAATPPVRTNFTWKANDRFYAVVVLNKVDKVFGNETRTAFFRYHRERLPSQTLDLQLLDLTPEYKLLLIGDFATAQEAIEYVQKAKPMAVTEVIPWLKQDKYFFTIISPANLEVLKANPDPALYRKFLEQNLPVKF